MLKKNDIDRIETCTSERKPSKALEIYMYLVLVKYTYGTCEKMFTESLSSTNKRRIASITPSPVRPILRY